jgi:predicted Zn-dependent protease
VLVRVREKGRRGHFRCGTTDAASLHAAVRNALAVARLDPNAADAARLTTPSQPPPAVDGLCDERVERLTGEEAKALLAREARQEETGRLDWTIASVVVVNNHGLRRAATATTVTAEARAGCGDGAGYAAAAARSLARLDLAALFSRARARRAGPSPSAVSLLDDGPLLLAPEAVATLLDLLNRHGLAASSYQGGSSFLRQHLGAQVFDRAFTLRDDPTNPAGLPFPFDLEGSDKSAVDLVVGGVIRTPALDRRSSISLGLAPTAHAIGGEEALATNLFLVAGELGEADLLRAGAGGRWISRLDQATLEDAQRGSFRARARGVRGIDAAGLERAVPDQVWESSLLRCFAHLLGVGRDVIVARTSSSFWGGITTPALLLESSGTFRPLRRGPA